MRRNKKVAFGLFPILLTLMAMLLVACGGSTSPGSSGGSGAPQPASADKQVLRYPIGDTDFGTIDPALVQNATDAYAIETIFTGLVQLDDKGGVIDQLAASHQVSSDGLTYTFTLKPGLKFSDGTPLTSQDVAYSINRVLLPATKSQVAYYLSLIKDYDKVVSGKQATAIGDGILVPDANTVKIVISKPAAYFLQALTYPCTYVVEKKIIDQYGTKWTDHLDQGGGAGPFKVSSYSHTTGLTVVANSNYYGKQPKMQKINFLISGDVDTTYKAYLAGQYDLAGVPAAQLASAKGRPDFHKAPLLVIRYLTMNYLAKPFDNIKIRQAFALAINKDLLVQTVLRGAVTPTNHIVPEGMVGYNANLKGPDGTTSTKGDSAKAKSLLQQGMQEEGYSSVSQIPPITFTYYTGSSTIANLVSALTQEWQTVLGINVKTTAVDFNKLVELEGNTNNSAGPLQLWILGWQADYPDPQDWLSTFFTKGADYNNFNYGQNKSSDAAQQQAVQAQLLQADVNQDTNARIQAYNAAEQQIVNDVGWIPLYQSATESLLNPKVQGYIFNALSITPPDDWANIYISQ